MDVGAVKQARDVSFEIKERKEQETATDRENINEKADLDSEDQEYENLKGVQEVDANV
ncbi:MAG: hypothetical protein LBQ87_05445 [Candidatus Fibromonas sp.]|jgi:hypothetical protein|nr:hypothetical protein [Candidatus Fibromonas sp.]